MSRLPRFTHGRVGALTHNHLNEVFERADQMRAEATQAFGVPANAVQADESGADSILAECLDTQGQPLPIPLARWIRWRQTQFNGSGAVVADDDGATSNADNMEDPYTEPALLMTPPYGLLHFMRNTDADTVWLWQPATSVYACEIVSVNGTAPSHNYNVRTYDRSIEATNQTPINRWVGIDYESLLPSAPALLLVTGDGGGDISLVAFETPMFASCPSAASAGVIQGADVAFLGL